jgi:hypothetical protein
MISNKKPWLARMMESAADSIIHNHERDLVGDYLDRHPELKVNPIEIPNFSFFTSTPAELREAGVALCREADRLESLTLFNPVYVMRDVNKMACEDFLFCDNNEKDVLVWIMKNLDHLKKLTTTLFREWWADDPATGKKRVIKREVVSDPVADAYRSPL